MSIEFDTDDQARQFASSRQFPGESRSPGMAGWLARHGIIKDESSAGPILIGIVVLNFILAAAVIYFFVFK